MIWIVVFVILAVNLLFMRWVVRELTIVTGNRIALWKWINNRYQYRQLKVMEDGDYYCPVHGKVDHRTVNYTAWKESPSNPTVDKTMCGLCFIDVLEQNGVAVFNELDHQHLKDC